MKQTDNRMQFHQGDEKKTNNTSQKAISANTSGIIPNTDNPYARDGASRAGAKLIVASPTFLASHFIHLWVMA